MIIKGSTSAYAVHAAMKATSKRKSEPGKVIAYVNVYKRIINLTNLKFLEEVHLVHMHGRRDFRVTINGMEQLIPYLLLQSRTEDFKAVFEYVSDLDKQMFQSMLLNKIYDILIRGESYCRIANAEMQIPSKDFMKIKMIGVKKPTVVQIAMTQKSKKR